MHEITCPHCTFLNPAGRKKCGMCLKLLTKRSVPGPTIAEPSSNSTTAHSQKSAGPAASRKRTRTASADESASEPSQTSSPHAPAPQETAAAPVALGPPPAPQDVTKLNTFFATASGKTVQVNKSSLAMATRKFSDFEGAAAAAARDGGASESEADSSACEGTGPSPALVATLFSTAGGKPVKVKATNLERAQERFDLNEEARQSHDTPEPVVSKGKPTTAPAALTHTSADLPHPRSGGPMKVSTLFSTAGGAVVHVSTASLAKAQAKFADNNDEEGDDSATSSSASDDGSRGSDVDDHADSCSSSPSPATPSEPRRGTAASSAQPIQRAPPALSAATGARRGFVPPQRIAPMPTPAATATRPSAPTVATAVEGSSSHGGPQRVAATRLACLSFHSDLFDSDAPTQIPSYAEIPNGFAFTSVSCSAKMLDTMGIAASDDTDTDDGRLRIEEKHFRQFLLSLGASRSHCTPEWCHHALLGALFKALRISRCVSPELEQAFTPGAVAVCLCQKYNNEIVEGRRPVLRQMAEGDVPSMSLATVFVSEHCPERSAPHTNVIRISDGYYHLKATLDIPLSNLLREGAIPIGQRLTVCGSRCLLSTPCSPWECTDRVVFSLNYNGVRPVGPTSPLGVAQAEPLPLPVALVHPMGGLVPVIKGVVARVMPPFFVTTQSTPPAPDIRTTTTEHAVSMKVVRNWHAQLQHVDHLMQDAQRAAGVAVAGPGSAVANEGQSQVARVTSALIVDEAGNEALIQQWENCTEEASVTEPDGVSDPVEGSTISVYGLTPAKAFNAFAPFTTAKLFHASRQLRYTTAARGAPPLRVISCCLNDSTTPYTMGSAVDVAGLFLGVAETDQGTFVLLLQEQDFYVVLHIPTPSARCKLSFALPSVEGVPVVVEHAVFVSRADGDAGSDCARIFAKEYTRVVQRSVQPLLSKALQQATGLTATFAQRRQKHHARRDAIFAQLREPSSFPSSTNTNRNGAGAEGEYEKDTRVGQARMLASGFGDGGGAGLSSVASAPDGIALGATGSKAARVPYYLRAANASQGGATATSAMPARVGCGVVLPDPKAPLPRLYDDLRHATATTGKALAVSPNTVSTASYGNVVSLRLRWEAASPNNRSDGSPSPWYNLLVADGDDDRLLVPPAVSPAECTPVFALSWRYDVGEGCVRTALIRSPAVLEALLEPCVGLQKVCNISADQKEVEWSLQRHALLRQWKKECPAGALWWNVLTRSRVVDATGGRDDINADDRMSWQAAEWATVKSMLRHATDTAFYRFNTDTTANELRSVHLIAEECKVSDLT